MNIRIVVADERQAAFFDVSRPETGLADRGMLENPAGGLKDTDLETDRAGRRYGGTTGASHGEAGPQSHHHGVDGERSAERHELTLFAKQVGQRIEADRVNHEFDKLVIMAPPRMLGLLRQQLPPSTQSMVAGEIAKDLLHHGPEAILNAVPRDAFARMH